ncbi:MAG: N-acetylneuraminate synthase family protein [Saprospiraceae bacterium]|nr:N-acetylneuraminate synthase family protein [Saprospiraceae bacterium]
MKTQLVAEIAQAHDGSLGILHSYIDALSTTGVQTIKFQIHIADAESSEFEKFRIPFSYVDASRKDYWKRMEFSKEQWILIKNHCEEKGMEFLATPFSLAAVRLLEELQVKRYKIGSGDISNLLLVDKIAETHKPIILSSGMSDWQELDRAVNYIRKLHNSISIMQCTTAYPCPPEQIGLHLIQEIKNRYHCPVGFSDHSGSIFAGIAAVALGATILEFHAVFDRRMFGPDSKASITIDEIKTLAEAISFVEKAFTLTNFKEASGNFEELKTMFGKSLVTNKSLSAGHTLTKDDLETAKPSGRGIPASDFEKVIERKLLINKEQYEFINWSDIQNG